MSSYLDAGVDLAGASNHVERIAKSVTDSWTGDVIGGFGGFAAGIRLPAGYTDPILMMSTDGVGTKLELARQSGHWSGVGSDLVAMCVDDLAAVGARAIGFVDYLAVGALSPERDSEIVTSVAAACTAVGCPLLGGETAEHPGVMDPTAVDLSGAALGVVEAAAVLGPERVRSGDNVIGLHSPNVRSNGFSLIRHVFGPDVIDNSDTLLEPSVIYAPTVLRATDEGLIRAGAHITGGGLVENLARALPPGLGVTIDRSCWEPPAVFDLIASKGVDENSMWETFNMGIGFCLITSPSNTDAVMNATADHSPVRLGIVEQGAGVSLS